MADETQIDDYIISGSLDIVSLGGAVLGMPPLPMATTATALGHLAKKWRRRTIDEARDIFISEVSRGNRDILNTEIPDEFIPIWYRYVTAALHGRARLNLRLLAKVMIGHTISPSLHPSDFLEFADIIESLRRDEIVYLGTMLKWTKQEVRVPKKDQFKGGGRQVYFGVAQSVAIKLRQELPTTPHFSDPASVATCALAVQRTGLLHKAMSTADGSDIFEPSPLLLRIAELADFEDALNSEGEVLP